MRRRLLTEQKENICSGNPERAGSLSIEDRVRDVMPPTPISPHAARAARRAARDGALNCDTPASLVEVAAGVAICRRCELRRGATQGVPGEGPAHAPLMLVGEQPGEQEDLAGTPFVGPAGKVLDRSASKRRPADQVAVQMARERIAAAKP